MHHRRNRTTRREIKRLDSKAFRMAEKEALERPPSVPPSDCWGRGAELPIPDDAPSNGRRRSKRVRKPKQRCSVNGSHEWYKERVDHEIPFYPYPWQADREVRYLRYSVLEHTCIHCWVTKLTDRVYDEPNLRIARRNRLTLPKRKVKLD
jgi:hypothetical protein